MKQFLSSRTIEDLRKGVQILLENPSESSRVGITRVSVELDNVSPLNWLVSRPMGERIYWSGRDYGIEVAAFGEADCQYSSDASDLEELRDNLKMMLAGSDYGVRYYGGIRFDLQQDRQEHWNSFGSWRFILPRFELRTNASGTTLLCNVVLPTDYDQIDTILDQIDAFAAPPAQSFSLPTPIAHTFHPDFSEWETMVNNALLSFNNSSLDKVVLAREANIDFSGLIDPVVVIDLLKQTTTNCFHFLFESNRHEAFLGASPERLFRREGRSIESEAVAGTRPRGKSDVDDERLINELYRSAKEQREHEFVRISLQEDISSLAAYVTMDTIPSVMRLASERHLVSRLRAIMHQQYTSLDGLEALHPSPAVGGYPSDLALDLIRNQEPFDRGWYAGPVGWIGVNEAEFAVAIRSGLVTGSKMRLYSGAGIVRGSTPSDEWYEIEHKIGDLAQILGFPTSSAHSESKNE